MRVDEGNTPQKGHPVTALPLDDTADFTDADRGFTGLEGVTADGEAGVLKTVLGFLDKPETNFAIVTP